MCQSEVSMGVCLYQHGQFVWTRRAGTARRGSEAHYSFCRLLAV